VSIGAPLSLVEVGASVLLEHAPRTNEARRRLK
jgi:hypothetical protein